MDLIAFVKALPKQKAAHFRKCLALKLAISASYARHLCNGRNRIPSRYALAIEALTEGHVPRFITAPDHYPQEEYKECYARICQDLA